MYHFQTRSNQLYQSIMMRTHQLYRSIMVISHQINLLIMVRGFDMIPTHIICLYNECLWYQIISKGTLLPSFCLHRDYPEFIIQPFHTTPSPSFYAPRSNDLGHIVFVLSIYLFVDNFNLCHNFWNIKEISYLAFKLNKWNPFKWNQGQWP